MITSNSIGQNVAEDLDSIISSKFSNYPEVPGIIVGVHHPEYGTFIIPKGVERLNDTTSIKADAIFSIGSVYKNFMWVLMHRLHQANVLDIYEEVYYDDPVGNEIYINQLQDTIYKYTGNYFSIADLMKHTTGMVDATRSNNFPISTTNDLYKEYSFPEILDQLFNTTKSTGVCPSVKSGICENFNFGVDNSYSSYGPNVVAEIAELETGINARQLQYTYIFEPLGLDATSHLAFDEPKGVLTPGHVCIKELAVCTSEYETYEWYNEDSSLYWNPYSTASLFRYPIYSSAADLLTYANAQFNDSSFLAPSIVDEMRNDYTIQFLIFKSGLGITNYEFLWSTNAADDDFWGHIGNATLGHGSSLAHRESDKLSIVVLTNVKPGASPYDQAPHFDMTKSIGIYFRELE